MVTIWTFRITNSELTPLALVFVLSVCVILCDIILTNRGAERAWQLAKIFLFHLCCNFLSCREFRTASLGSSFFVVFTKLFLDTCLINAVRCWLHTPRKLWLFFRTYRACGNGINLVVTSMGQRQKSESSTGVRPVAVQILSGCF